MFGIIYALGAGLIVLGLFLLLFKPSFGVVCFVLGCVFAFVASFVQRLKQMKAVKQMQETATSPARVEKPEPSKDQIFYLHTSRDTEKNIAQLKDHFIVVDTETTGVNPNSDRMVALAAIKYQSGSMTDRFYTLVNPERPIPSAASSVNGIYDKDVAGAPKEAVVMPKFAEFVGDAMTGKTLFVAYNAPFDMKVIKNAMERCGIAGNVRSFDVLWYARKRIKELKNYKQITVAKHLRINASEAHQADCDCEMCANILMELLKDA